MHASIITGSLVSNTHNAIFSVADLKHCLSAVRQGCQVKDHIVQLEELEDGQTAPNKVYDDLLAYRQAITVTVKPPKPSTL